MPIENRTRLDAELTALRQLATRLLSAPDNRPLLNSVLGTFDDIVRVNRAAAPVLTILKNQFISIFESRRDEPTYTAKLALRELDKAWTKAESTFDTLEPPKQKGSNSDHVHDVSGKTAVAIRKAAQTIEADLVRRKGLVFTAAPVLPMIPMRTELLTAKGVAADSFSGYAVLMKQWVLFVTHDYVSALLAESGDLPQDLDGLNPKQRKAYDSAVSNAYDEVVHTVCSRHKMSLVSDHVSHWKKARAYWLSTPAQLAQLRACSFGNRFAPTKWSLAFPGAL